MNTPEMQILTWKLTRSSKHKIDSFFLELLNVEGDVLRIRSTMVNFKSPFFHHHFLENILVFSLSISSKSKFDPTINGFRCRLPLGVEDVEKLLQEFSLREKDVGAFSHTNSRRLTART